MQQGAELSVKVVPNARQNALTVNSAGILVEVTATPEDGKANKKVTELLARGLGLPKGRLTLLRGAKFRHKVFRID